MEIIKATVNNLAIISSLFNQYRIFYNQPDNLEEATRFIEARLKNSESVILLAQENIKGKVEGAGFTQLYPSFSSVAMQKIWILNDLFVAPEFRKQQVATGLINKATELCKETGAIRLTLETDRDNYSAQALYEKIGFERADHCYFFNLNV